MRELIRTLRRDGHCVLFSSHIMQEVSALCDHIVIIADGKVVAQGSKERLLEQAECSSLEDAFVVLTGIDEIPAEKGKRGEPDA
jgi:sodium transport system ATP-binding protein